MYFCAIGVLNAYSLAVNGSFYGILPFEAFTLKYLPTTLMLFGLILAGVFVSVGSYFFDREKGWGFSSQKKDKGYSRWCKDKEERRT